MNLPIMSLKADEAVNWFRKHLNNAVNYGLSSEEFKLFEIFMTSTLADVDIKKQITNSVLPTFFENIVSRKVNKITIDAQASIIRLLMKYYSGTCGQFKNALNKFTSKVLSECFNEGNIILKVTKYLALYPQCGGRGQQGINHAEAWTGQFNDYIYSANYFLNQIYSDVNFFVGINVTDDYEGKFDISVFNLSELEKMSPKERYEKLTSLFVFFNTAIQSMLLSMFSTVKHFDSNEVIEFVLRTLSVTPEKLNATVTTENKIALDSVLWKLHCSVIKTISALIKCCGRVLIPQGILIDRVLLLSLNMTQFNSLNSIYGTTRSKLQQRVLTYQVLRSWQAVSGSQSLLEMFSENLTSGILFDIKYDKPSLNLIVDKQTGNKKRKSGALNEKMINQRDIIVMHDFHANKNICNEAHLTLQLFLNTMSSNLKQLEFKIFQSTIMGLLLEIIKCQQPNDYPLPYYDDVCRLNLYKTLLAIVISPHPQCITQTSVAVRLFTLGTMDRNEKIKEFCRSSLSKLEHIIRPRNDTLFFPLENELDIETAEKSTLDNKNHFLSDIVKDPVISNKEIPPEVCSVSEPEPIIPPCTSNSTITNVDVSTESTTIIPQEIKEVCQKQTVQPPVIPELNDTSTETPMNIDIVEAKKVVEPMDIDSNTESSIVNDSLVYDSAKVMEMLKDFVDND